VRCRRFRNGDPDHEQQHQRLDVGLVVDGEPLVWLGEEEVEPHPRGKRCQDPGEPVPVRGDGHHHHDEDERDMRVGETVAERHQHDAKGERSEQGEQEREAIPSQPLAHPHTVLVWSRGKAAELPDGWRPSGSSTRIAQPSA
jgi:hypothetical protein